ncbi:MAG TPA: MarR family transcriptional regulator [Syntrophomonadaceae bacterium]|nr:MarR family transcriptional regulator [Syntrophomonadaceae bacterium]
MSNLDNVVEDFLTLLGFIKNNFFRPAEQITRSRLSPGQFHAVTILYHKGSLPMSELACEMKISKQQLTPLICKLIDSNLVVRQTEEQDRRIVRIEITEEGRRAFRELMARMKQAFREKLSVLPDTELEELDQMLKSIQTMLNSVT